MACCRGNFMSASPCDNCYVRWWTRLWDNGNVSLGIACLPSGRILLSVTLVIHLSSPRATRHLAMTSSKNFSDVCKLDQWSWKLYCVSSPSFMCYANKFGCLDIDWRGRKASFFSISLWFRQTIVFSRWQITFSNRFKRLVEWQTSQSTHVHTNIHASIEPSSLTPYRAKRKKKPFQDENWFVVTIGAIMYRWRHLLH